MKQTRWRIVLSLVLAFAAGAAAGVFAVKVVWPPSGHHRSAYRGPSPQEWEKALGLSAEQVAKIHEIFKNNDSRIDTLRSDFFEHVKEIRSEIHREIDAVLTPEQKAKNDAMMEKFREASKERADRPAPDSGPDGGASKEKKDEKEGPVGSGDPGRDRRDHPYPFPY